MTRAAAWLLVLGGVLAFDRAAAEAMLPKELGGAFAALCGLLLIFRRTAAAPAHALDWGVAALAAAKLAVLAAGSAGPESWAEARPSLVAAVAYVFLRLSGYRDEHGRAVWTAAAGVAAAGAALQLAGVDPLGLRNPAYSAGHPDASFGFANPNALAYLLVLVLPVLAGGPRSAPRLAVAAGAAAAALLMRSAGAALALLSLASTLRGKARWAAGAAGLAALILLPGGADKLQGRLELWRASAEAAWRAPLRGGPGLPGRLLEARAARPGSSFAGPPAHAHNEPLQAWATGGIPALAGTLAFLFALGRARLPVAPPFLVACLFEVPTLCFPLLLAVVCCAAAKANADAGREARPKAAPLRLAFAPALAAAVACLWSGVRQRQAEAHWALGQRAFLDGDWRRAEEGYRRSLDWDPGSPRGLAGAALAGRRLGRETSELEPLLRRALERGTDPKLLLALGDLKREGGDAAGARLLYKEAARLAPRDTVALNRLGLAEAEAGRFGPAFAAWSNVLAARPRDRETLLNLEALQRRELERPAFGWRKSLGILEALESRRPLEEAEALSLLRAAARYVDAGVPYRLGGADTPETLASKARLGYRPGLDSGIDCSQLVVNAAREALRGKSAFLPAVLLPSGQPAFFPDASAAALQELNTAAVGEPELRPGDLLFFRRPGRGDVEHVAVLESRDERGYTVIDASSEQGRVLRRRYDRLDPSFRSALAGFGRLLALPSSG